MSVSKNSIKNLFHELLREKRSFKYIISAKITLEKQINDNEFDPKTLHFNSLVKTVINQISFKWLIWRNTKSTRHME